MKKVIFVIIGILILAGIISASFFYFSKNNKVVAQDAEVIKPDLEVESPKTPDLGVELPSEVKLLFIGDMMFDRYIRQVAERKGYDFIFGNTDDILKGSDLVIGNLEGPITSNQSVSINSEFGARENYIFTFDPQVAGVLKNHNINLVNLGNNHILNFDQEGLAQTKKNLDNSDIGYFCDPNNSELRVTNYELQKLKIAFVCYNQFEGGGEQKTLNDIETAKEKADLVILYAHWGKEYETEPMEKTKSLAHKFVDAGTDLIIGAHPHVVQESEIHRNKTIYYSLGNFIFDQYFDPNATKGLAVKVIINPDNKKINYQEYKLQLKNNGQTELVK